MTYQEILQDALSDAADRHDIHSGAIYAKSRRQPAICARQDVQLSMWAHGIKLEAIAQEFDCDRATVHSNVRAAALRLLRNSCEKALQHTPT